MITVQSAHTNTATQRAASSAGSGLASGEATTATHRPVDTVVVSGTGSAGAPDGVRLKALATGPKRDVQGVPSSPAIDPSSLKAFRAYMDTARQQHEEIVKSDPDGMASEENCLGASWEDYQKLQPRIATEKVLAPFRALSSDELFALVDYTDGAYHMVNDCRRSPDGKVEPDPYQPELTADLAKTEGALITSALGKLPKFRGEVFRGEVYGDEMIADGAVERVEKKFDSLRPGTTYTDPGFMSTTRDGESMYPTRSLLVYHIQSRSGARIDPISSREGEQEVLFRPDTEFKVVRREIEAVTDDPMNETGHRYAVWLEEK